MSGRNWKRRFFTITPYHLSYYVDESANQKPKGTIVITPDARVEEDKSDKRHGFSFKYISKDENITLAAVSELDRTHWMQTIESVIKISARYLKEYVTILPDSTVLHTNAKNAFGMKIAPPKNAIRKYCILADEVITIHPDKEGITIIDAVLNVNCKSTLVGTNDNDRTITVTDSDPKQTRMTMQFVANHDYQTWKQAITRFIKGEEEKVSKHFS